MISHKYLTLIMIIYELYFPVNFKDTSLGQSHSCFLTCCLYPPPDDQIHLAVSCRPVHQVNDVSVRLPHHRDPVHKQQLITGPQASIKVCWTLLDDRTDQDLLLHVDC